MVFRSTYRNRDINKLIVIVVSDKREFETRSRSIQLHENTGKFGVFFVSVSVSREQVHG